MNFKKILVASIFLLAIMTLGAVSAAEDADMLAAGDNAGDSLNAPADEVIIASDDLDDIDDGDFDDGEIDDYEEEEDYDGPVTVDYPYGGDDNENVSIVRGDSDQRFYIRSNDDSNILNYTLYIDGEEIFNGEVTGEFTFNLTNLDDGYHTWNMSYVAYYWGTDDEDNPEIQIEDSDFQSGSFTLSYYTLELPNEKVYSSDCEVIVRLINNATGRIVVTLNGTEVYNRTVKTSKDDEYYSCYAYFEDLDYGIYTYEVAYSGDGNYDPFTKAGLFERTYRFNVEMGDFLVYGYNLSGEIYMDLSVVGNVTVTLNGKTYSVHIPERDYEDYDERGIPFTLDNFIMGKNIVSFSYEDDDHPLKVLNYTVEVYPEIVTPGYEIVWGEDAVISLVLPEDAEGNLYIYWEDADENVTVIFNQTLVNGKASYAFDTSKLAHYDFNAEYTGSDYEVDTKYYGSFFVVPKVSVTEKMWSGNKNDIVIELPQGTPGNLAVYVTRDYDDEDKITLYNSTITSAKINVPTSILDEGDYRVYLNYESENYSFYGVSGKYFQITDEDPSFELDVDADEVVVKYGEVPYIFREIYLPADANGVIAIYVDGKLHEYVDARDANEYSGDVENLTIGKHTWEIRYSGDTYYNSASLKGSFRLTYFSIPDEMTNMDSFDIYFDNEATGYVSVTIDGKAYDIQYVDGGMVSIDTSRLSVGEHTYSIRYSGDENNTGETVTGSFYIEPYFSADVQEDYPYAYGTFEMTIALPSDANGYAYVSIDDKAAKKVKITEGIGEFADPTLSVGYHDLEITYGDWCKYYYFEIEEKYIIQSTVGFMMDYGDNESIFLVLPQKATGKLIVTINGVDTTVNVVNGRASYSLNKLGAGFYNITARYEGTYNVEEIDLGYSEDEGRQEFTVSPKAIYPEEVNLGDNITFVIQLQNGTSGHFKYVVREWVYDEDDYEDGYYRNITTADVPIINGTATYTITNVSMAYYDYEEVFLYIGEERIPDVSVSYGIGLDIDGVDSISVGTDTGFDINLPEDANGNITVTLDDGTNFTVEVVNGKASVPLAMMTAGDHSVAMQYNGNYGTIERTKTLSVSKNQVNATVANVKFSGNTVSFDIVLTANATGKLLGLFDKTTFEKEIVDGKVSITVNNPTYGKRSVIVAYAGDGSYLGFNNELSVTVPSPKITSKVSSVVYLFGSYSVTVVGIDGKAVSGTDVVFKINGKKIGTVKTNKKGVASIKIKNAPKKYNIVAEALKVKLVKKVNVKHALTLKAVNVKKSAKKLVLTATLKNGKKGIKNQKITFKFNGKKYTAKTNKKGVAKLTIKKNVLKKLKVGKKVKYQATYLKDTVKKSAKVKK